jgi:hypothetical protein
MITKTEMLYEMEKSAPFLQRRNFGQMTIIDAEAESMLASLGTVNGPESPEERVCAHMTALWCDPKAGGYCMEAPLNASKPKPDGKSYKDRARSEMLRWFVARYGGYVPIALDAADNDASHKVHAQWRRNAREFFQNNPPEES